VLAAGVDVGTLYTKVVLMRDDVVVAMLMERTTMDSASQTRRMLDATLESVGESPKATVEVFSTGAGRKNVPFAVEQKTDYITMCTGARFLFPSARMVLDIGGQGIRIVELDDIGVMQNFRTNDKCSTGTGCFLETMSVALNIEHEVMGELGLAAKNPCRIQSICTVFGESEVVSLVAKGRPKEEILAGLYGMVAQKVSTMIRSMGLRRDVVAVGGVARSKGIIKHIEDLIKCPVLVPKYPHMVCALGAALGAASRAKRKATSLQTQPQVQATGTGGA
jgi:(R)-2-hydroxyacyl-CoA dehydratese activating ATPase